MCSNTYETTDYKGFYLILCNYLSENYFTILFVEYIIWGHFLNIYYNIYSNLLLI